ncbi:MAG: hypothetical protein ACU0A6_07635 [Shimia sp.]|jgi:hypothetical protein|uniref:hypothetical protein n=1 Tax=Shimia sp. TaxID=1954381 RepID=UPI0040597C25
MTQTEFTVSEILRDYPDCPQREMALRALRKGHTAATAEWLEVLRGLMDEGNSNNKDGFAASDGLRRA